VPKGRSRKQQPIPAHAAAAPPFGPQPAPAHIQQLILGYNPNGKMITMDIESSQSAWSVFTLADGAKVRIKGVLIDAKKAVDQYAPDGKPIYILQMTLVSDVDVSEELMKKKSEV
jgi:hypothetical protein